MTTCTIGTEQAARISGASSRQIGYWCSSGLITPQTPARGPGSERKFGFMDLLRLRILAQLRGAGIPLQRIRKALEQLGEWNEKDPLASGRLLAVGDRLYWTESDAVLVDILKRQRAMAPVVLLDLAELAQETEAELRRVRAA